MNSSRCQTAVAWQEGAVTADNEQVHALCSRGTVSPTLFSLIRLLRTHRGGWHALVSGADTLYYTGKHTSSGKVATVQTKNYLAPLVDCNIKGNHLIPPRKSKQTTLRPSSISVTLFMFVARYGVSTYLGNYRQYIHGETWVYSRWILSNMQEIHQCHQVLAEQRWTKWLHTLLEMLERLRTNC